MLRKSLVILWSSFLVAALAEGFFFSLFDPRDLIEAVSAGGRLAVAPVAVYTIGFMFFWVFCMLASLLSCYLADLRHDDRAPF